MSIEDNSGQAWESVEDYDEKEAICSQIHEKYRHREKKEKFSIQGRSLDQEKTFFAVRSDMKLGIFRYDAGSDEFVFDPQDSRLTAEFMTKFELDFDMFHFVEV